MGLGILSCGIGLLGGCTRVPLRPKLVYEGERRAPIVVEGRLQRFDAVPPSAVILGTVTAQCVRQRPVAAQFSVPFGALVCSEQWLARVVEEQAQTVGGSALHRFSCETSLLADAKNPEERRIECSGNVLAYKPDAREGTAVAPLRAGVFMTASVDFAGTGMAGPGASPEAPYERASEVPAQPIADRALGTLSVKIPAPGTVDDARNVLLLAAGSLGWAHVIAPNCMASANATGWTCLGRVATPEVDPRRVPSAR